VGETAAPGASSKPIGRRVFFGVIGLGGLGVVFGSWLQSIESTLLSVFSRSGGIAGVLPGSDRFRIYSVTYSLPVIADLSYRLTVGGLAARTMELTLDELRAMPPTALVKDFQCVTGWRVPDVHWRGVRLSHLLDLVGPDRRATAVEFTSYDGTYTESLTLDQARRYDVIVAYEMLGAPISAAHGGPVRLYVAPMYGYKSAKWLRSINLVRHARPGYWEQNGYAIDAWIGRSNGRTDRPVD
jgi:DMSO/TMAO reductase YedYZ molybdopterin-dependent catalytic subunit